jgi:DNA-binding cell septation regulator SpoVG
MLQEIKLQMKVIDKPANAVKAICDVAIHFEELGAIQISGFRVLENGRGLWVSPPSRHGQTRWFELVTLRGSLKSAVEQAILREFERHRQSPPTK